MKQMSDERAEYIAQALDDESIETSPQVEFRDPIKELGFARIEHVITLDAELSDGAYRTYALLHYYWQRKDAAWVGSDTLASVRNLTEATISNHLKELRGAGLISRQRRMGKSSMTYLEDLPERYVESAKFILSKRKKIQGKLSKKLDVSPLKKSMSGSDEKARKNEDKSDQNRRAMRTIEGESLKENHRDSKTESPHSDEIPSQPSTEDISHSIPVIQNEKVKPDAPRSAYTQAGNNVGAKSDSAAEYKKRIEAAAAAYDGKREGVADARKGTKAEEQQAIDDLATRLVGVVHQADVPLNNVPSSERQTARNLARVKLEDVRNQVMTWEQITTTLGKFRNGGYEKIKARVEKKKTNTDRLWAIVDAMDGAITKAGDSQVIVASDGGLYV